MTSNNQPNWLVCVPAYGRKLTTKAQVLDHYKAGRDFRILGPKTSGTYVSSHEAAKYNLTLEIRYGTDLSKLHVIAPN